MIALRPEMLRYRPAGTRRAPVETETVIRYGLTKTGKRGPVAGLRKDPGNYGQWQFASR